MSGEQAGRHEPDGKEDAIDSSLNVPAAQNTLEGTREETVVSQNEAVEACSSEVTPINNQLSDDSLEDDVVPPDIPVVANVARDDKTETDHNGTNSKTVSNNLNEQAANHSTHCTDEQSRVTKERGSVDSNADSSSTALSSSGHVTNRSDNVKRGVAKVTASGGSLQSNSAKLSPQSSSRFSTSSSRIPVLKGSKAKPSPLLDLHKASTSSVTTTTPGEFSQEELNSPAQQNSENTDTPVSVALQYIPSSDSLHQDFNRTGDPRKVTNLSNKPKETTVTTQAHHRGWNGQKYAGKPSQLPVPMKRGRQDGHILNNSNSFNSYVHEQMAITMAMMEANFEGVGLSNTQQERVEELRAGLDSFSLTNITAAPVLDQKTVFKNSNRHRHHANHDNSNHRDVWLTEHHKRHDVNYYYDSRAYHDDQGVHQLYRSQSYSTNPNHGSYGNTVHHQRRGSEIPHDEMKRRGSYLQQQLDRRGSYLQQSKLSQSIKSLRPPKLKPLPRKKSSNYLQNYMKSNSNRPAVGRVREWSPAHMMPPLDESTPLSHAHYWMGDHVISDGNYGNGSYNTQHHYPVLPSIGENYSSISLHPVKPYNSYQQQCPGPPSHGAAAHPRGNYYMEHDYWRHRS